MQTVNTKATGCSNQPGLIAWKAIPDFIQKTLTAQGCILLKHRRACPQLQHIRFQYVPLSFQGDLYYLQKWSLHEWGISPSQIIFPGEGPCSLDMLSNGSRLSLLVKKAVAKSYGHFPDNSPFQPPSSTRRYRGDNTLPLAG